MTRLGGLCHDNVVSILECLAKMHLEGRKPHYPTPSVALAPLLLPSWLSSAVLFASTGRAPATRGRTTCNHPHPHLDVDGLDVDDGAYHDVDHNADEAVDDDPLAVDQGQGTSSSSSDDLRRDHEFRPPAEGQLEWGPTWTGLRMETGGERVSASVSTAPTNGKVVRHGYHGNDDDDDDDDEDEDDDGDDDKEYSRYLNSTSPSP